MSTIAEVVGSTRLLKEHPERVRDGVAKVRYTRPRISDEIEWRYKRGTRKGACRCKVQTKLVLDEIPPCPLCCLSVKASRG